MREWVSRLVSDHGCPHASPRRRPRKAIRCHIAYSRSSATKSRKAPVCWGVQTITGDGFSPVCSHLATRSSVHTSAFGLRTGSISTWARRVDRDDLLPDRVVQGRAERGPDVLTRGGAGDATKGQHLVDRGLHRLAASAVIHALPRDGRQLVDRGPPLGVVLQDLGVGVADVREHLAEVADAQPVQAAVSDTRLQVHADVGLVAAEAGLAYALARQPPVEPLAHRQAADEVLAGVEAPPGLIP